MFRRAFWQSPSVLLGGFALPALTQAKPAARQWKALQVSPVGGSITGVKHCDCGLPPDKTSA